jgi:hypothetical protein
MTGGFVTISVMTDVSDDWWLRDDISDDWLLRGHR